MGKLLITPHMLRGAVRAPASKSMAHRALICAALCDGESALTGVEPSDDILATAGALISLGAALDMRGETLFVAGTGRDREARDCVVDCAESGSTLRFLLPVFLVNGGVMHFTGRGNLGKRPLDDYFAIFDRQGIHWEKSGEALNLTVEGRLSSGHFALRGDVSSQFLSGLLFALPGLDGDSEIEITTPLESAQYIELTLAAMRAFGFVIERTGIRSFHIPGGQCGTARDFAVEGDYSGAANWLCAAALGADLRVENLDPRSLQGDRAVIDILTRMGARFSWEGGAVRCAAGRLRGVTIDASACPDIVMPLAAAAATAEGVTRFENAGRLRIKECDRLHAVADVLTALGARVEEGEDSLTIEGVEALSGGAVSSHGDHRIAMMAAVASLSCQGPVTIDGYECVSKSYPRFFDDFMELGGCVHELSME